MDSPNPFHWKGPHHGYLGIILTIGGGFFLFVNQGNNLDFLNPIYKFLILSGGYLIIDDVIEHKITNSSPLRLLWERIIKR